MSLPSSSLVRPRRRSLEVDNDIFIVQRHSFSANPATLLFPQPDVMPGRGSGEHVHAHAPVVGDEQLGTETFLQTRRGMRLIGENNNPRYQWYPTISSAVSSGNCNVSGVALLTEYLSPTARKAPILQDGGSVTADAKADVRVLHDRFICLAWFDSSVLRQ